MKNSKSCRPRSLVSFEELQSIALGSEKQERNNAGEGLARGHREPRPPAIAACRRCVAPLKKRTQQIFAEDNLPETLLRKELGLSVSQSLCLPSRRCS